MTVPILCECKPSYQNTKYLTRSEKIIMPSDPITNMIDNKGCNLICCAVRHLKNMLNRCRNGMTKKILDTINNQINLKIFFFIFDPTDDHSRFFFNKNSLHL